MGRAWKFSGSATGIKGPAPRLGEANDYVLRELLGITQETMDRLEEDWIIGNIPAVSYTHLRAHETLR